MKNNNAAVQPMYTAPTLYQGELLDLRDTGFVCGCCGLFVKRYRRSLNSNMALMLLVIYRSGKSGFVHLEELMQKAGYKRSGDASYLVHWRFLEKCTETREDGSSRNGKYRITPMGIMFVEQKVNARKYILMFNGKFEGFNGDEIDIKTALGNKFNYSQLMEL